MTVVSWKSCQMKKLMNPAVLSAIAVLFFFSGCVKDHCKSTYKIYIPVYKSLTQVRAGMRSEPARALTHTGKIYVYGNYVLINEVDKGIHIINNSNPAAPQNLAFINIPGNVDLSVKDGYLYADSYSDLVVLDISNPANATPVKFLDNVFPYRNMYFYGNGTSTDPDSIQVIADYIEKDTTVNCETYNMWNSCLRCKYLTAGGDIFTASVSQTGQGGSTARFTIVNNYLYTVATNELRSFNISNAYDPQEVNSFPLGWNIETIYPFNNNLFIGSSTGIFIFSLANPASPSMTSQFSHFTACDPVIADGQHAFVTLRTSGTRCQGATNELDVLNISNLSSPTLLRIYPLNSPLGLAKDGNLLFVCDGNKGLKIYNASDAVNLQLLKTITSFEPADVILKDRKALVVATDGLYQFDYANPNDIRLISKISISR
jgi:hypothetical protein